MTRARTTEPTLMGLDFFRKSVEYTRKHQRPGTSILYTNDVIRRMMVRF